MNYVLITGCSTGIGYETAKFLKEKRTKSKMILQVHDELLFEMFESEINYLSMDIKKIMENSTLPEIKLDIPLIVDMGHGASWAEAH